MDLLERGLPLGEINLQRQFTLGVGQTCGRGDVADLAAHRLQDEDGVCRATAVVFFVGHLDVMRPVAGGAAVAGGMVDELEFAVANVVVDCFGAADADDIETPRPGEVGDGVGRVHRVVPADVAEVPDVVGLEDFDDAVEVVGLFVLELVAAGADRTGRGGGPQEGDLVGALRGEVDQFFLEHAFDAMPAAVDGADFGHLPRGFNDAAERVVDDGRGAARLGDDHVFRRHGRGEPGEANARVPPRATVAGRSTKPG